MSINVTMHENHEKKGGRPNSVFMDPVQIKQEIFEQRRIQRLAQVRMKSKELAEKLRNNVKEENRKNLKYLEEKKTSELESWREKALAGLKDAHHKSFLNFGEAHRAAITENETKIETKCKRLAGKKYNKENYAVGANVQEEERIRGGGCGSGNRRLLAHSEFDDSDDEENSENNQFSSSDRVLLVNNTESQETDSRIRDSEKSHNNFNCSSGHLSKSAIYKYEIPPNKNKTPNRKVFLIKNEGNSSDDTISKDPPIPPRRELAKKYQSNNVKLSKKPLTNIMKGHKIYKNSTGESKVKFGPRKTYSDLTNRKTIKNQKQTTSLMRHKHLNDSESENPFLSRPRAGTNKSNRNPGPMIPFKPQRIVLECHMQEDNTLSCKTVHDKKLQEDTSSESTSLSENDDCSISSSTLRSADYCLDPLPPYCGIRKPVPKSQLTANRSVVLEVGSDDSRSSPSRFASNIQDAHNDSNRHFSRVHSKTSLYSISSSSDNQTLDNEPVIGARGRFTQITDLLNKIKETCLPICAGHIKCACHDINHDVVNNSKDVRSRGVGTSKSDKQSFSAGPESDQDSIKKNADANSNATKNVVASVSSGPIIKSTSDLKKSSLSKKPSVSVESNKFKSSSDATTDKQIKRSTIPAVKKKPTVSSTSSKLQTKILPGHKSAESSPYKKQSSYSTASRTTQSTIQTKKTIQTNPSKVSTTTKKTLEPTKTPSQVEFYDYNNKYEKQYTAPPAANAVQHTPEIDIPNANDAANIERQVQKGREAELELLRERAEKRGQEAIEREQVRREYELLNAKLDALAKDKIHSRAVQQPQDENLFSDVRLKQILKARKSKINSAIEEILQRPCIITCPEVENCSCPLSTKNPHNIIQNSINLAYHGNLCADQSDSCCSILLNYVEKQKTQIADDIENCDSKEKIEQLKTLLQRLTDLKSELNKQIQMSEAECDSESVEFVTAAVEELWKERGHILQPNANLNILEKREKRVEKKEAILEKKLREFYDIRNSTTKVTTTPSGKSIEPNKNTSNESFLSVRAEQLSDGKPIEIVIKLKSNAIETVPQQPATGQVTDKHKKKQYTVAKSITPLQYTPEIDSKSEISHSTAYRSPPAKMTNAIDKLMTEREKLIETIPLDTLNEKTKKTKKKSTNGFPTKKILNSSGTRASSRASSIKRNSGDGDFGKKKETTKTSILPKSIFKTSTTKTSNGRTSTEKGPSTKNTSDNSANKRTSVVMNVAQKFINPRISMGKTKATVDRPESPTKRDSNNSPTRTTKKIKKSKLTLPEEPEKKKTTSNASINNPELNAYIQRLLGMSRNSINMLGVSSSASIDTPNSSVCQTDENMAESQLHAERIERLQRFIEDNYTLLSEIEESLKLEDQNSSGRSDANQKMIVEIWRRVFKNKEKQTDANKQMLKSIKPILRKETMKCMETKKKKSGKSDTFSEKSDEAKLEYLDCFTEASGIVNQRIIELTKMINRVRREKQKIFENTFSSTETKSETGKNSTEYLDFANNNKLIQCDLSEGSEPTMSQSSSRRTSGNLDRETSPPISFDEQDIRVPETPLYEHIHLERNKLTGASRDSGISLSRPLTAMEPSDSPDTRFEFKSTTNSYEPLLKDIPKPYKDSKSLQTLTPTPTTSERNRRFSKPPPTLTRFSPQIVEDIPHELSTIFETDTPGTSRVISTRQISTDKSVDTTSLKTSSDDLVYTKFPTFEEYARMHNLDVTNFDAETNAQLNQEFQELLELTQSLKDIRYSQFPSMDSSGAIRNRFESTSSCSSSRFANSDSFDTAMQSLQDLKCNFKQFPTAAQYFKSVGAGDLLSPRSNEDENLPDDDDQLSAEGESLPDVNKELKRRNILKHSFCGQEAEVSAEYDRTNDDLCTTSILSSTKKTSKDCETMSGVDNIDNTSSAAAKYKQSESEDDYANISWAATMIKKTKACNNACGSSTTSDNSYAKQCRLSNRTSEGTQNNPKMPADSPCFEITPTSTSSTDSTIPGDPINLRAFLAHELRKRTQNSSTSSDDSLGSLFLRSILGSLTPSTKYSNYGGQSSDRQQKTSTPVQLQSPSLSPHGNTRDSTMASTQLFSGESRLSSVRGNRSTTSDKSDKK